MGGRERMEVLVRPGKLARGGEYYKASGFHRQD